ncbi:acetate/propionate family kinase [Stappia sp. ICDLI1TA098]
MTAAAPVLVINAGSSSIKFQLFDGETSRLRGKVDGLGAHPRLTIDAVGGQERATRALSPAEAACHDSALAVVVAWLDTHMPQLALSAVGHRVVHGGAEHTEPLVIDDAALEELAGLIPLAPLHQPHNLAGIRAARAAFPDVPQIACFDTAFHRGHGRIEDTFALPAHFYDDGVRRYGFHGLSYEFISGEIARTHPTLAQGRIVVAHLGNGASLCAVKAGRSVSTTMGLSALDGLPMGTRCGQIDPGVLLYLLEHGMDATALAELLYHKSGLLGLSGISHDMRVLEASDDPAAALAIDHFAARIRREIGALSAVMDGLDGIVFTAGIGENSPLLRKKVCAGLGFLGVDLDEEANLRQETGISAPGSRVTVLRMATDEERMIARHALALVST